MGTKRRTALVAATAAALACTLTGCGSDDPQPQFAPPVSTSTTPTAPPTSGSPRPKPWQVKSDDGAVAFVKAFVSSGKPVGVICHGPWTMITADVVRGRTLASWPSLQTDLRNAGATWKDEEVVVDGSIVSSRNPDDLPAFCAKVVEVFAASRSTSSTSSEQAPVAG